MLSRIKWGPASSRTITFEHPLFDVVTDRPAREGSEWADAPSGVHDAWIVGKDYTMECEVRFLRDTSTSYTPIGGLNGWQDFLDYARAQNTFTFIPNVASTAINITGCSLDNPKRGFGDPDALHRRTVRLTISNPTYDFNRAFRGALYSGPY